MTHHLPSTDDLKQQARRLRTALAARGTELSHGHALELVAAQHGVRDWNTLSASASGPRAGDDAYGPVIPVLRIFDVAKAREFYLGFLGFTQDWEHTFDDHSPSYLQVSRSGAVLHLSEHHGDATPGATVRILVPDAAAVQRELVGRDYRYARPGLETMPWGLEVQVGDPFANRLVFHQLVEGGDEVDHDEAASGPIEHDLRVEGSPAHAFDVLTARIGTWWDPVYAPPGLRDVVIEPRVGGGCTMLLDGGGSYRWGTVTAWEPGSRYAQTFSLGGDANHPTEVDIAFEPDGDGTLVRFRHGGWTAANVAGRPRFTDWPVILERYVDACRLP